MAKFLIFLVWLNILVAKFLILSQQVIGIGGSYLNKLIKEGSRKINVDLYLKNLYEASWELMDILYEASLI